MDLKRGNVYWVNLDPAKGSEIKKLRPCVLIGATPINKVRRTVIVAPLSTAGKYNPPITISVDCLGKKAVAVCDQIRAVDKSRLIKLAGKVSNDDMDKISEGLKQVLYLH